MIVIAPWRRLGRLFGLVFLILLPDVNGQQENVGELTLVASKIEIQSPESLIGKLNHRGALFGKNHFDKSITKNLYYTKRPLCNGQVPDTPDYIKTEGYFLLVDRGGCSFVEKARNAQNDNATAVLIADNSCLCSIAGSCEADEECEEVEPTMDDDGTGNDIQIPAFLLFKPDADRLRQELMTGTMIEMTILFPVPPATNGRTEYTLWLTPDDVMSHQFLTTFFEAAIGFGNHAYFKPRMLVKDGSEKGCRQYDESHIPCNGYCTNYGRYCEPRSYYDTDQYENKGTKMIVESLRRACIWKIYGQSDGIGREWWSYVQMWMLNCSFSHYSTNCAEGVFPVAGINKTDVESCMSSSGNFREDVTNDLLESFLVEAANHHVKWTPKLLVNGALIQGALTFGNVIEAICATFDQSEKPSICSAWNECALLCRHDADCVLWGSEQECAEYRAPFLSNADKQFDDDYIFVHSDGTIDVSTNFTSPPTEELIPSTDAPSNVPIATKDPTGWPTLPNNHEQVQALSQVPLSAPIDKPRPTPLPSEGTSIFDTPQNVKYPGEHQEVVETIQIYEGGNGLAIGLGVGAGCVVIFFVFFLLLARERRVRNRLRELEFSHHNMVIPTSLARGDWSASSRNQCSDRRPPPQDYYLEDDLYEDEEFYCEPTYPLPRQGRFRFFRSRQADPTRLYGARVARNEVPTANEVDHEIEGLIAAHFSNKKRRQQHEFGTSDDKPKTRVRMPRHQPLSRTSKKIKEVIHQEDAPSLSSPRRSQRAGSW